MEFYLKIIKILDNLYSVYKVKFMSKITWQEKIQKYCEDFNLPLYYLADTLNDPKVIPMIRGKAFEYSVLEKLQNILDPKIWKVSKPYLNPQLGSHDSDVLIEHIESSIKINIECKLSAKGKVKSDGDLTTISVKCMRSRTLGEKMVKNIAPMLGVTEQQLKTHNDQYTPVNFDFVITTIGNAFYETDSVGKYIFSLDLSKIPFLNNFPGKDLKKETFNTFYVASSKKLSVKKENGIVCTRRTCSEPTKCGFIPNYPEIKFKNNSIDPINNWEHINKIDVLVHNYVTEKLSSQE